MAKNFGKIVLGAVAISAAVGGVYYFLTKKERTSSSDFDDEDFDAFDVEFDEDDASRSYTSLDSVPAKEETADEDETEAETPVSETETSATDAADTVEDFFNDEQ